MRILTLCLGNICRSPAAEAAIAEAATAAGLEVDVESAGTGPWHVGQPPDVQVKAAGQRAGLRIDGAGRQVTAASDLAEYDLILAMDGANLAAARALAPDLAQRIQLFRSFDPDRDHDEVPDPYGMPDSYFDDTVRIVRAAARGVVQALQRGELP